MITSVVYAIGTRPEMIRSAGIIRAMELTPELDVVILDTGQHYDYRMMRLFREEFGVTATTVELGVKATNAVQQTSKIMARSGEAIDELRPDIVCVFGDTNSSLAVALAAMKSCVRLAHIEAGCRSFDRRMQEEQNRRLIDHVADLLIAVSPAGQRNLIREGVCGSIHLCGDPQFDAFLAASAGPATRKNRARSRVGLVTIHRPENVDDRHHLAEILKTLDESSQRTGLTWNFPVHPRTAKLLPASVGRSIRVIDPLSYQDLLAMLSKADVCVTDSGGLQKDAFWMRVPCVTLRPSTEWTETVDAGDNTLVSSTSEMVAAIEASSATDLGELKYNPYGSGDAAQQIVNLITVWFSNSAEAPIR
jgi:UDP-N-acetylglucosamine 2-epimerase